MSMTPQQLVDQAICIDCEIPKGMQMPVLIALFAQILANGGTGGGGGVNNFAGSGPPTTQVPTNGAGTYWDYTNQILYNWYPLTGTWAQ